LKPFAADCWLERMKPGGVAAGMRQCCDETAAERIGYLNTIGIVRVADCSAETAGLA
jgi:hypothetical protein